MKKILLIFIILNVTCHNLMGQDHEMQSKPSASVPQASYFQTGLHYVSDVVFMGRKDSVRSPYAGVSLGIYHSKGLFFQSTAYRLVASSQQRNDLLSITGGHTFEVKKIEGKVSATSHFFNGESYSVKSQVRWDFSANVGINLGAIYVNIDGTALLNTGSTDFFAGFELIQRYYEPQDKLKIDNSLSVHLGTQNYYEDHYQYQDIESAPSVQSAFTHDADKFCILDIRWSLPVSYTHGNFMLSFIPTFSVPVNNKRVTPQGGALEDINNVFYCTAGITYVLDL